MICNGRYMDRQMTNVRKEKREMYSTYFYFLFNLFKDLLSVAYCISFNLSSVYFTVSVLDKNISQPLDWQSNLPYQVKIIKNEKQYDNIINYDMTLKFNEIQYCIKINNATSNINGKLRHQVPSYYLNHMLLLF